jgi:hypothetical protein
MSASESAASCPGRTECDLDAEYPYFYLSEHTSLINHRVPTWSGMVTASAGKLKLQLPSRVNRACVALEIHRVEPAVVLDRFDDVIEFGYPSATGDAALLDWSRALVCDLPPLPSGPGDYRIRYHVREFAETAGSPGSPALPRAVALIQIWPGSCRDQTELKITSTFGNFWHPGARLRRARER